MLLFAIPLKFESGKNSVSQRNVMEKLGKINLKDNGHPVCVNRPQVSLALSFRLRVL